MVAGRGPTRLMSPFTTFHSWGSSSSEVFRRNRPTRVTRGSFEILNSGPVRPFMARTSSTRSSALVTMLRNFNMSNRAASRP